MTSSKVCLAFLTFLSFGIYGLAIDTPVRGTQPTSTNALVANPAPRLKEVEILSTRKADYPKEAKKQHIQGEVLVKVDIADDGKVSRAEVVQGNPLFSEAALKAARGYKFKPILREGKPVAGSTILPIDFYFPENLQAPRDIVLSLATSSATSAPTATLVPGKGYITVGKLLRSIQPAYPNQAKQSRIQGVVVLKAVIGKDGRIGSLHIVSGPLELRQASLDAVWMWRYEPFLLNGAPVEIDTEITVKFALH